MLLQSFAQSSSPSHFPSLFDGTGELIRTVSAPYWQSATEKERGGGELVVLWSTGRRRGWYSRGGGGGKREVGVGWGVGGASRLFPRPLSHSLTVRPPSAAAAPLSLVAGEGGRKPPAPFPPTGLSLWRVGGGFRAVRQQR